MVKKSHGKGAVAGVGAALGAAAAIAGYYFYADPNAKKHRKLAARWAGGLKKDVVKEVKMLKKIDRASVAKAVNKVASAYQKATKDKRAEIAHAAGELKKNWARIQKEVGSTVRKQISRRKK